jgi:hypothetical protein
MPYEAKLPAGVTLPEGHRIDSADPRYRALEQIATSQKFSQETFSNLLGLEAKKVSAEYERARAAAVPPRLLPPSPTSAV